jgi:hypothetical protein
VSLRNVCNLLGAAALLFSTGIRAAPAEGVAVTFDDLPTLALTRSFSYANTTTVRLLAVLH